MRAYDSRESKRSNRFVTVGAIYAPTFMKLHTKLKLNREALVFVVSLFTLRSKEVMRSAVDRIYAGSSPVVGTGALCSMINTII